MATDKEIFNLVVKCADAYPYFKPRSLEGLVKTWIEKFGDVDIKVLTNAIDLHLDESQYFPSIHDVKSRLATAEYNVLNENAAGFDRYDLDTLAAEDWGAATEEAREFWSDMMAADGRKMVSPGVWL